MQMIFRQHPGLDKRLGFATLLVLLAAASGCSTGKVHADAADQTASALPTVGLAAVTEKSIGRNLTVSSELVPFQEIDVYAKESGYVRDLRVDYGTRVQKGQLMAVLEIPELQMRLAHDAAAIQRAGDQVANAQNEVSHIKAQYNVAHLQFSRLKSVADSRPGLIAQQELDDWQGKALAMEAQVAGAESTLLAARSRLDMAKAQQQQDQVMFDYARITAPFAGVVTQRYANLGTLMQAGTSSSTQAMPLVRLSQDDLFRLVIPVPESYVKYIRVGDPVRVRVPSLDKLFPGRVTRFSVDVTADTRTMHTEVDVPNSSHVLMPGLYAEATLTLEHKNHALVVPLQAVSHTGSEATVLTVDENRRVQLRKIGIGFETANEAEVLSGLEVGDRVVVSDRSGLKPGEEVRPQVVDVLRYQGENEQQ
jgi:RND family efflux transporter MFP subunit